MNKKQPTKRGKRPTMKACRKLGKAFALIIGSDLLPVRLKNDLLPHLADIGTDAQLPIQRACVKSSRTGVPSNGKA